MATNTPNYNLIKPGGNDPVNIADINGNSDIIDTTLKSLNDRILPIATQAQAQAGTDNTNLMTPLRVAESMLFKTLTGVNDFNNITVSGRYSIGGGNLTLNLPPKFNAAVSCHLEVFNTGGNILPIQKLMQSSSGYSWIRGRQGSSASSPWTVWRRLDNDIATQAQAQTGTDNDTLMTPLRTKQAIESLTQKIAPMPNNSFNNNSIPSSYPLGESLFFSNGLTGDEMFAEYSFATIVTQIGFISGIVTNGIQYAIPYRPYSEGSVVKYRIAQLNTPNPQTSTWGPWKVLSYDIATTTEAKTGTNDNNVMTPLKTKQAIDNSPINRYGTATGTNALTITANPLFDNLYNGLTVKFKNTTANTGNVTINVNSKGVKPVLNNDGTQIQPGKLKSNAMYEITYDGVNFYLTKGGGESSPIKRVQRGTTTINAIDTTISINIPSFNANKSVLKISSRISGSTSGGTSPSNNILAEITDNTTLNFSRGISSTYNIIVSWELIEYEDYVNVQHGTSVLSGTSLSTTINSVDLNKSQLFFSYKSSDVGEYAQNTTGFMSNSTTINFLRSSGNGQNTINWFVVEM